MANNQIMPGAYDDEDVVTLDAPQAVNGGPANPVIIVDEVVHHHPAANVAETARRNPANTRKERWGFPLTSRPRTQYPPYFSAKLRELISYIPHQRGYNIRPIIVEILQQNFTEDQIVDVSGMLALARPNVLRSMANILVEILQQCYNSPRGQRIEMSDPDTNNPNMRIVRNWFYSLVDYRFQETMRTSYTVENLYHLLFDHTHFIARPTPEVRVRVVITPCDLQTSRQRRTRELAQAFIDSLPVVPPQQLGEDDTCCICFDKFLQLEDAVEHAISPVDKQIQDQPLRLPCNHVFGRLCLAELFKPMDDPALEHKKCPMCRAPFDALLA